MNYRLLTRIAARVVLTFCNKTVGNFQVVMSDQNQDQDQDPRTDVFHRVLLNRLVFDENQIIQPSNEDLQYITGDDLSESYGSRGLSTILAESDWYDMAKVLRDFASKDQTVIASRTDQNLLEELLKRLESVPSIAIVKEKVNVETAQQYRVDWEEIEAAGQYQVNTDEQARNWSRPQCLLATELMSILNSPDPLVSYQEYKQRQFKISQEKRKRLRDRNAPVIEQVKQMGIWFPMPKQRQQWFDEEPHAARKLFEVVDRIRLQTKFTRMIQYIPRRKFTTAAVFNVDHNVQQLKKAFSHCFQ